MTYYIIYPKKTRNIKPFIVSHKPSSSEQSVFGGFAEGSFKNKKDAINRIQYMGYSYTPKSKTEKRYNREIIREYLRKKR